MTLQAKELRIGNWIQIGGNTLETYQTYKPYQITPRILAAIAEENEERPSAILSVFMPIKLTEEWLLRFGFKKNPPIFKSYPLHPYLVNNGVVCFFNEPNEFGDFLAGYAEMRMGEYYAVGAIWIKHVHQLQNLFYALTGQELEIKEQP